MSTTYNSNSSDPIENDTRRGPFAIVPKYDCPHLGENAYVLLQQPDADEGRQPPCADCKHTEENWACLNENCNYVGCSRYKGKHMLNHHQSTGHNICLSFSDRSVFCYACDSYIDSPQLHLLNRQLNRPSQ